MGILIGQGDLSQQANRQRHVQNANRLGSRVDIVGGLVTGVGGQITNEQPSGLINDSNTLFDTSQVYIIGTTQLFLNGLRLRQGVGNDYIEGGGTLLSLSLPPSSGDVLIVDYSVVV